MMKLQKRFLFLSALVATSLVACNNAKPEPQPQVDNTHVDVFVLSGQSNMEGSTYLMSSFFLVNPIWKVAHTMSIQMALNY